MPTARVSQEKMGGGLVGELQAQVLKTDHNSESVKKGWLFGVVIAQVVKTDHGQPEKRETGGKGGQLVELWAG